MAATYAIDAIADAISTVSAQRSALGAVQNRLEHTINNNILSQAGQSMLAQANQSNQGVLSLLG
jgi:flagellin